MGGHGVANIAGEEHTAVEPSLWGLSNIGSVNIIYTVRYIFVTLWHRDPTDIF